MKAIRPQDGNQVVDLLISRLGEDCEKVMLKVGSSKPLLAKFQETVKNDPMGLDTAMFLQDQKTRIRNSTKKTSQAPKPSVSIKGGGAVTSASAKALKKAYDKADGQEAYNIGKKARAAGHDTKEW